MNKVKVEFEYDETVRLWEVYVYGVTSAKEAIHAFNAVLITAAEARPGMHHIAEANGESFKLKIGL